MNYLERATAIKEDLIANRRHLHQNPELGFDLPVTTRFVWDKLTQLGYEPAQCGRAGITATVGRPGGKTILLRADMDALPMREESGLPFASTTDRAHTCGHDMHTAILLGAAWLLKENEDNLAGTVKLLFQPAEEILEGAKSVIAAGVLDNPAVDAAMGLHMLPLAPTGAVLYNTGAVTASSDTIHITVKGKGGHGAQPAAAIDPINVAAHIHIACQELIAREVDPNQSVVLTFGSIQAGSAHNIIPESALMLGTLRAFDETTRSFMLARIGEVADHTAKAFRASAALEIPSSASSVVVDEAVAETVTNGLRELLGQRVVQVYRRGEGSEDFSEISQRVPSLFFALGAGSREEGYTHSLHNPQVRFNEDSLPYGVAALAHGATYWLANASGAPTAPPSPTPPPSSAPPRKNGGWTRRG